MTNEKSIDSPMYVYAGKCRLCDCGIDAGRTDMDGKPLFTGDIVIIFTKDYLPSGLTVIVSNRYQTYSDGRHELTEDNDAYPMGIKSVWINDVDGESEWRVRKVKDNSEVVDGEHWSNYGFRFSRS